ncbi:unnamed protein product [Phytomonas sp. EM1]|nr:unnamed protein product [Phytomonas sp. EM1]|eukprot:CCW60391.1 unnamed protein product [Phytomonas sp. isolate EM1]
MVGANKLVEIDACEGGRVESNEEDSAVNYSHWASSKPGMGLQGPITKTRQVDAQGMQHKNSLITFHRKRKERLYRALFTENHTKATPTSAVKGKQALSEPKMIPNFTTLRLDSNVHTPSPSTLSNSGLSLTSELSAELPQAVDEDDPRTNLSAPSRTHPYDSPEFSRPPMAPSKDRRLPAADQPWKSYLNPPKDSHGNIISNSLTHPGYVRMHSKRSTPRDGRSSLVVPANFRSHRGLTGLEFLKEIYRVHEVKKATPTIHEIKTPLRPAHASARKSGPSPNGPSPEARHAPHPIAASSPSHPFSLLRAFHGRGASRQGVRPRMSGEGRTPPAEALKSPYVATPLVSSNLPSHTFSSVQPHTREAEEGGWDRAGIPLLQSDPHREGGDPVQEEVGDLEALIDQLLHEVHRLRESNNRLTEQHRNARAELSFVNAQIDMMKERIQCEQKALRRAERGWRRSVNLRRDYQREVAWELSLRQFICHSKLQQARIADQRQRKVEGEVFRRVASGDAVVFPGEDTNWNKHRTLQRQIAKLQKRYSRLVMAVAAQQLPSVENTPLKDSTSQDAVHDVAQRETAAVVTPLPSPATAVRKENVVYSIKKQKTHIPSGDPKAAKEKVPGSPLRRVSAQGCAATTLR